MVYRTLEPAASLDEFAAFIRSRVPEPLPSDDDCRRLFETYRPDAHSLADKGYIAGVHPLELWVVAYLRNHPDPDREALMSESERERLDVYRWLFKPGRRAAQDRRLETILEVEAFLEIHRSWQRLGYPFDALVPSYATALGSSGDRPAALAGLLGIILNNGLRAPTRSISAFRFARGTPFEATLAPGFDAEERVLPPEVAAIVRDELFGVVEEGTGRRARGAFAFHGRQLRVGGKTGTGDNRFQVYAGGGRLAHSRHINRVATFAFIIDERFFGTITAYVDGDRSSEYRFTSALPTQLFHLLAPIFAPLTGAWEGPPTESPSTGDEARTGLALVGADSTATSGGGEENSGHVTESWKSIDARGHAGYDRK